MLTVSNMQELILENNHIAPSYVLNQLLLKGMNRTYDALLSEYDFKDFAYSKMRERYKAWTGNSMEEKLFDSFEMRDDHGKLTNAGALLADDAPIKHSRLFCTRWNGLDKSGGMVDALDSAEYSGSLIILLNEGVGFRKTEHENPLEENRQLPY